MSFLCTWWYFWVHYGTFGYIMVLFSTWWYFSLLDGTFRYLIVYLNLLLINLLLIEDGASLDHLLQKYSLDEILSFLDEIHIKNEPAPLPFPPFLPSVMFFYIKVKKKLHWLQNPRWPPKQKILCARGRRGGGGWGGIGWGDPYKKMG